MRVNHSWFEFQWEGFSVVTLHFCLYLHVVVDAMRRVQLNRSIFNFFKVIDRDCSQFLEMSIIDVVLWFHKKHSMGVYSVHFWHIFDSIKCTNVAHNLDSLCVLLLLSIGSWYWTLSCYFFFALSLSLYTIWLNVVSQKCQVSHASFSELLPILENKQFQICVLCSDYIMSIKLFDFSSSKIQLIKFRVVLLFEFCNTTVFSVVGVYVFWLHFVYLQRISSYLSNFFVLRFNVCTFSVLSRRYTCD